MLKIIIFALSVCAFFAFTVFNVNGQQLTEKELELQDMIVKTDAKIDLNDPQAAAAHLSQAEQIILQNPNIDNNLQGHFHKVKGKIYMKTSLYQALEHFNAATSRFAGNATEQARVELFVGIAYYYADDLSAAQIYFNAAKEYFIESEDEAYLAQALNNLGVIAFRQGNESAAVGLCEQALLINTETEYYISAARIQFNLDYFADSVISDIEGYYERANLGGGGSSGSGTTVNTGGGGTVIVNNGN